MKPTLLAITCVVCFTTLLQAEEWPRFRGPTGQGETTETGLPTEWGPEKNIAWKTSIPGIGWSSPIIFADRVFLTTATDDNKSCRVLCVDRRGGDILWNREVFRQVPKKKEDFNSYATPTPVTDGQRVYAAFSDGSFVALDMEGKVVWRNREAQFYSQHGLGASPILYGDLLIMTFDGSAESGELRHGWQTPWDKSYVIALNKNTGKTRWKTMRGMSRISHMTPTILRDTGHGDLILSAAGDVIQAFDPDDGHIVWTIKNKGEGVVPSPVVGDGLIFTISGFQRHVFRTVKTGGEGDVTETHIVWEDDQSVPRVPSMIYKSPYLFSITDRGGVATCREAKTGEVVWRERIGGDHHASPILAGEHIYFLSREGETAIIEAAGQFNEVARNTIDEPCQASFGVSGGQLFLRSESHLFCIGK